MTHHPSPAHNTRATPRQATSYVTAPAAEPLLDDDPLLQFAPVPHVNPRRNSITPDRQRRFIAHLAATGVVIQAAKHIGASMEALYKLRRRPGAEDFSAAWDRAVDAGIGRLEDAAIQRAIVGEERLVVSAGKVLGTERRHNEALVMFLLRTRRADRYAAAVVPGHPLYERIRREVTADIEKRYALQEHEDEEAILASLTAKLSAMHQRHLENEALMAEFAAEDDEGDADRDD
ncbi:hypothetical protein GRI62_03700 [Erythrobacter arachoides]|uniref:Terminase small subunit n=1 Tax=Aurantiacibacter arachoides TaxID=1850444 RepID=A0A844ZWN7_9SPHN|nr:hypothetical protein [Aurantiacibacter arachoides]MXO92711.1 hypothetical protein [Aurantiacibacter arachoides]GGD55064.1 hypothetical protein GCM10011411_13770 [Aurantiacibacter arachoides]